MPAMIVVFRKLNRHIIAFGSLKHFQSMLEDAIPAVVREGESPQALHNDRVHGRAKNGSHDYPRPGASDLCQMTKYGQASGSGWDPKAIQKK